MGSGYDKDPQKYHTRWSGIDFRAEPTRYAVGKGEQGVLMAQPYKSEILPHWRFKTPEIAKASATKIYEMFLEYVSQQDFVGADMARKYLQMGLTRSRRYANHSSGVKYARDRSILPLEPDRMTNDKAKSAEIFTVYYDLARNNEWYVQRKKEWVRLYG